jgi:SHS2 domain-containing protein
MSERRRVMQSPSGFTLIDHTADVGFEAWAGSTSELLRSAFHALASIAFELSSVRDDDEYLIEVSGEDWPDALVNFLNEVLYLFDAEHFAAFDCRIETASSPRHVRAALVGERRDPARHPWKLIVKAITYHDLSVKASDEEWRARVVLDV